MITIILLYVCQGCGWAPKFDFDYWVLPGKGVQGGWYCAKCGAKCCKTQKSGAVGIFFKGDRRNESFLSRIGMPNGKFCNLFTFFKFLNCLRTGNMFIVQDSSALIDELVQDFKRISTADDELAVNNIRECGAIRSNVQIKCPKAIEMKWVTLTAETDILTLSPWHATTFEYPQGLDFWSR